MDQPETPKEGTSKQTSFCSTKVLATWVMGLGLLIVAETASTAVVAVTKWWLGLFLGVLIITGFFLYFYFIWRHPEQSKLTNRKLVLMAAVIVGWFCGIPNGMALEQYALIAYPQYENVPTSQAPTPAIADLPASSIIRFESDALVDASIGARYVMTKTGRLECVAPIVNYAQSEAIGQRKVNVAYWAWDSTSDCCGAPDARFKQVSRSAAHGKQQTQHSMHPTSLLERSSAQSNTQHQQKQQQQQTTTHAITHLSTAPATSTCSWSGPGAGLMLNIDSDDLALLDKVISNSESRNNLNSISNPPVIVQWYSESDIQKQQVGYTHRIMLIGVVSLLGFATWPFFYWLWKRLSH